MYLEVIWEIIVSYCTIPRFLNNMDVVVNTVHIIGGKLNQLKNWEISTF